jgi:hypothetical protein
MKEEVLPILQVYSKHAQKAKKGGETTLVCDILEICQI